MDRALAARRFFQALDNAAWCDLCVTFHRPLPLHLPRRRAYEPALRRAAPGAGDLRGRLCAPPPRLVLPSPRPLPLPPPPRRAYEPAIRRAAPGAGDLPEPLCLHPPPP